MTQRRITPPTVAGVGPGDQMLHPIHDIESHDQEYPFTTTQSHLASQQVQVGTQLPIMRLPSTLLYTGLTLGALGALTYASKSPQSPFRMSDQNQAPTVATASSPLLLSDTLAAQRSLSIFSSLARDDHLTSSTFSTNTGYTIVLAPVNSAIKALSHRPWEDPADAKAMGGVAQSAEDGVSRAERNVRRWVQGCLVTGEAGKEWAQGEKRQRGSEESGKKEVWWEVKDGKQMIMPEGFVVQGVVSRVANGEVWALEGTFEK